MSRSFKLVALLVMWLLALLGFSGCGTATAVATPTLRQPTSVALLIPQNNLFFTSLVSGAEESAAHLGITLLLRVANEDINTQQTQMSEVIAQNVQAIIIVPVDTVAIVPSMEAAAAAGIPIFTVDRSAESVPVIAHIASDNVNGGRMAANYLAEAIGKKGYVVELTGIAGTSAAQQRGQGFNEALAAFPEIEVIARETANFDRNEAEQVFAQILARQPKITAVFAHNDDMILGAIAAAQAAGRADEIIFVGFDAIADAIIALEQAALDATIAQQPAEMGRLGVETVVRYLQGETVPGFIPVELSLITR